MAGGDRVPAGEEARVPQGWVVAIVALLIAAGVTSAILLSLRSMRARMREERRSILEEGRREADRIRREGELAAKHERLARKESWEKEEAELRRELRASQRRIEKKEEGLERREVGLHKRERFLDEREKQLSRRLAEVERIREKLDEDRGLVQERLLQVSRMSREEALEHLEKAFAAEIEVERDRMLAKHQAAIKEDTDLLAQEVITTAIVRTCVAHTTEASVSTIDLPADNLKGRIIGREGRNIRTFEKVTGCDLVVDDTPGLVIVSSFDPVRREIARLTLERLLADGRIHPARIEETFEKVQQDVEDDVRKTGREALREMEIHHVHPRIVECIGRLKFRYSYGQNVLVHSKEVGWLAASMAAELRLDPALARRCGFLHDIGKAVDQETEGGHPAVGFEIAKRCDENPRVVNAIGGHHGDIPSISPYTPLVQAADAISASRPGARLDSLERYIKRLRTLEETVASFDGVKNAYAIQAGREVRVLVNPERVNDQASLRLARDIAKRIESQLTYPGEIKVTLIREKRVVEYAR